MKKLILLLTVIILQSPIINNKSSIISAQTAAELFGPAPMSILPLKENTIVSSRKSSDVRLCGYVMNCVNGTVPNGPVMFSVLNADPLEQLENQSDKQSIVAGTWADGKWYGIVYVDNKLVTIDTSTGARNIIGDLTPPGTYEVWTGMTYDYKTNTMYVLSSSGYSSTLSIVNPNNAQLTVVGTTSDSTALSCLAADKEGQLYSVDIITNIFGSVDKTTGEWTEIGPTTFDVNFAQSMEYDFSSENGGLYYSAYTEFGGILYLVIPSIGKMITVNLYEGNAQVTGFAIPNTEPTNISINEKTMNSDISIYPNPSNGEFTIGISLPAGKAGGKEKGVSALSGVETIIEIYTIDGKLVYNEYIDAETRHASSLQIYTDLNKGIYFIKISSGEKIFAPITKKIIIN